MITTNSNTLYYVHYMAQQMEMYRILRIKKTRFKIIIRNYILADLHLYYNVKKARYKYNCIGYTSQHFEMNCATWLILITSNVIWNVRHIISRWILCLEWISLEWTLFEMNATAFWGGYWALNSLVTITGDRVCTAP